MTFYWLIRLPIDWSIHCWLTFYLDLGLDLVLLFVELDLIIGVSWTPIGFSENLYEAILQDDFFPLWSVFAQASMQKMFVSFFVVNEWFFFLIDWIQIHIHILMYMRTLLEQESSCKMTSNSMSFENGK